MEKATDEELVAQMFVTEDPVEPEEETEEAPDDPTEPVEGEGEQEPPEGDEDDENVSESEDEDEDPEGDEDEEKPGELYTVKVDGQERKVPLDELLRGYAGQSYIQKGMAEAAEMRKAVQAEAQQLQQHRQQLVQMYERVQAEGFIAPPQPPDPKMLESDPIGYMQADAQFRQASQAYAQQRQQIAYLQQQEQRQMEEARQRNIAAQAEALREAFKDELSDPEKGRQFQQRLAKGAQEHYGFAPQDLAGIEDARAVKVLNDAIAYRELQAKQQSGKRPKEQPKAVTKPQAKMPQGNKLQRKKQFEKAMKSQKDDDFIPLLFKT